MSLLPETETKENVYQVKVPKSSRVKPKGLVVVVVVFVWDTMS